MLQLSIGFLSLITVFHFLSSEQALIGNWEAEMSTISRAGRVVFFCFVFVFPVVNFQRRILATLTPSASHAHVYL